MIDLVVVCSKLISCVINCFWFCLWFRLLYFCKYNCGIYYRFSTRVVRCWFTWSQFLDIPSCSGPAFQTLGLLLGYVHSSTVYNTRHRRKKIFCRNNLVRHHGLSGGNFCSSMHAAVKNGKINWTFVIGWFVGRNQSKCGRFIIQRNQIHGTDLIDNTDTVMMNTNTTTIRDTLLLWFFPLNLHNVLFILIRTLKKSKYRIR